MQSQDNILMALMVAGIGLQLAVLAVVLRRGRPASAVRSVAGGTVLDSCALIDGRVHCIAKAGFIPQPLLIPDQVIAELQHLADTADAHKRARARFGLDVARQLQQSDDLTVELVASSEPARPTDDAITDIARSRQAALYTTDFNLNKVARLKSVTVLNVNELAQAIRPSHLPGERLSLKVVQKGEAAGQGVGYLEEGTMAVIEGGARCIGTTVTVQVTRMLQTEAGKMVFAELAHKDNSHTRRRKAG